MNPRDSTTPAEYFDTYDETNICSNCGEEYSYSDESPSCCKVGFCCVGCCHQFKRDQNENRL